MMPKEEKTVRVLPANVYDTLELSAEAYGGIGAGAFQEYVHEQTQFGYSQIVCKGPHCVWGHAGHAADGHGPIQNALARVGISFGVNDEAVYAINKRKGSKRSDARVSFPEWCAELNVVRGA